MLAERGLLSLSKEGKISDINHTQGNEINHIDEASKKARLNSVAMPHIPLPGHPGPLTKT